VRQKRVIPNARVTHAFLKAQCWLKTLVVKRIINGNVSPLSYALLKGVMAHVLLLQIAFE
jgi:hypothetical protein